MPNPDRSIEPGGSGRTYSGVWLAGQVAGKPLLGRPETPASPLLRRHSSGSQRFLKPGGVGIRLQGANKMAGASKKREARKSLRQAGVDHPRWRLRRPPLRGAGYVERGSQDHDRGFQRVVGPARGWRLRATPGPGGTAKWSGAGESRSASNSSASKIGLARDKRRDAKHPARDHVVTLPASIAAAEQPGRQKLDPPRAEKPLPLKRDAGAAMPARPMVRAL